MQQINDDVGWVEDNNSEKSIKICFQAACNLFLELVILIDEYETEAESESSTLSADEIFEREAVRDLIGGSF